MQRLILLLGALVLAGALPAAACAKPRPKVIRVVEHADTDATTDTGPTGDSAGDIITFGQMDVVFHADRAPAAKEKDAPIPTFTIVGEATPPPTDESHSESADEIDQTARRPSLQLGLALDLDPGRLEEAAHHVVVADQQNHLGRLARPVAVHQQLERLVGEAHVAAHLVGDAAEQVQLLAEPQRVLDLPPGAFCPPPKVRSSVVRLRFRPPRVDVGTRSVFERVVRGLFLLRRKTLANALKPVAASFGQSAAQILDRAQLDGGRRPETLSVDDVARLARAVL